MKKVIKESAEQVIELDITKARKYLDQMIDIANSFFLYDLHEDKIPDYEIMLNFYHIHQTGKMFEFDNQAEDFKDQYSTVLTVWNVIEETYPKLAKYATEAHSSIIGEEVFEEVISYDEIFEEGESIFKFFFPASPPEVIQLQNFIRLTRIAYNMRYLAFYLYKKNNPSPSFEMIMAYKADWKNEIYYIPSRVVVNRRSKKIVERNHPFNITSKSQNNRIIGTFQSNPSFMERVLSEIDILQVKICGNCYKIFFAEPRNMKYCTSTCNNRMKSKIYSRKKKQLELGFSEEKMRMWEDLDYAGKNEGK